MLPDRDSCAMSMFVMSLSMSSVEENTPRQRHHDIILGDSWLLLGMHENSSVRPTTYSHMSQTVCCPTVFSNCCARLECGST